MKGVFFVLLSLNIILVAVQWVSHRGLEQKAVYVEDSKAGEIKFLNELKVKESVKEGLDKSCYLVGPILDESAAISLKNLLASVGVSVGWVRQEIDKAPAYWVYFEVKGEKGETLSKYNEFQGKGIDSFIINTGALKGNISLGVFLNIDSARRLKKSMEQRGYKAEISEIEKGEKAYWLLLQQDYAADNADEIDEIMRPVLKQYEMRQIFCKSVASEKQFP